jgi:hypothetical protein
MIFVHVVVLVLMSILAGAGIHALCYFGAKNSDNALYLSVPLSVVVCGVFGALYMDLLIQAGVF